MKTHIPLACLVAAMAAAPSNAATYTGANGAYNADSWNNATNWDSGAGPVPTGTVNVEIGSGKVAWAVNATTIYTGNLTLRSNATLGLGPTAANNTHYALGTSVNTSTITMESGSQIIMRYGAAYTYNQLINLTGNASIKLSDSTSAHNQARTFASQISGAYAFTLYGQNGNVANLNATNNGFSSFTAADGGSDNWKVVAGASGSLGTGNVTIQNGANLILNAANAIADTGVLTLNGARSTKVAGETSKLQMNNSDTVGGLSISSTITQNLIGGTGVLTVNGPSSIDIASATTGTVLSQIAGTTALTKTGAGILSINSASTYTGATTISGGTLTLGASGSIANSSSITVGSGASFDVSGVTGGFSLGANQTLSGPGTVSGSMTITGTLSPGSSPGLLATGSQIWVNGGDYNWQLHDATAAAGIGYDQINVTGTLDLTTLGAGGFNINLWTLSALSPDTNGNALNFDNSQNQSWVILTTTGGISGFNEAKFAVNVGANNGTSGFSNALAGGTFSLSADSNNLILNYATAIPEPQCALLGGLGTLLLLRRRRSRI